MPLKLSQMIQAGLPTMDFGSMPEVDRGGPLGGADRQLAGRARAGRRGRRITPVELPAAPDRRQGRARAGRRLHRRAQAERGGAAQRLHPRRDHRRGRPAAPACSTWSPASARWSARRSPRTPTSTWSRFTGSTRAGRRVSELAAGDGQAGRARARRQVAQRHPRRRRPRSRRSPTASRKCFLNSGQTCSALHPDARAPRAARRGRGRSPRRRPRRTRSATRSTTSTRLGPLVSDDPARAGARLHREGRRRGRQARHRRRRGARGPRPAATSCGPPSSPTSTPDMTIAQEEIFGPVLSIMPYDDEDEAVRDRQRHRSTASPAACGRATSERAKRRRPAHPHRPGRDQRRRLQPAGARSAATSSPGTAASSGRFGLEEFLEVKSLQLSSQGG